MKVEKSEYAFAAQRLATCHLIGPYNFALLQEMRERYTGKNIWCIEHGNGFLGKKQWFGLTQIHVVKFHEVMSEIEKSEESPTKDYLLKLRHEGIEFFSLKRSRYGRKVSGLLNATFYLRLLPHSTIDSTQKKPLEKLLRANALTLHYPIIVNPSENTIQLYDVPSQSYLPVKTRGDR